ncbi:MAG: transcriptional regulator, PadR family [Verrucomicrobiales bacterium]|nr:transcriptional regulator, PadR family [Verrucomicrobiales bacterium]
MGRKSVGWKTLWSLTVLCFLKMKPMHPYQLQRVIKATHKDAFLQLKSGSLYNAIARLLEVGLIEAEETSRVGRRPERTVYHITARGITESAQWLGELLSQPNADSTPFYAALSFLPSLNPKDVIRHLQVRDGHLEKEIKSQKEVLKRLIPKIGRLVLLEEEFSIARRIAERNWVRSIVADLESGKISWNPDLVRQHAAQFFSSDEMCQPKLKTSKRS